jgi:hypothetical protein
MSPKYPITVQLTGNDGNAFNILASVSRALKDYGVSPDEVNTFTQEAMSGDYENLLLTASLWVEVE